MKSLQIPFLFVLVLMAGCASFGERDLRADLVKAEVSYQAVTDTAVSLRDRGIIERGSSLEDNITEALVAADDALGEASLAVQEDRADDAQGKILTALRIVNNLAAQLAEIENE